MGFLHIFHVFYDFNDFVGFLRFLCYLVNFFIFYWFLINFPLSDTRTEGRVENWQTIRAAINEKEEGIKILK